MTRLGLNIALPSNWTLAPWGSLGFYGQLTTSLDEMDFTLSKTGRLTPDIDWTFGHSYFTYETAHHFNLPHESRETFVGVTLKTLPVKPALNIYDDWETGRGVYSSIAGTKELPFGINKGEPPVSFGFGTGYSDGQWGMPPGLSDVTASLSFPFKMMGKVFTPSVNYSLAPKKQHDSTNAVVKKHKLWIGLNYAFDIK